VQCPATKQTYVRCVGPHGDVRDWQGERGHSGDSSATGRGGGGHERHGADAATDNEPTISRCTSPSIALGRRTKPSTAVTMDGSPPANVLKSMLSSRVDAAKPATGHSRVRNTAGVGATSSIALPAHAHAHAHEPTATRHPPLSLRSRCAAVTAAIVSRQHRGMQRQHSLRTVWTNV
jgi:hypothetical protein